MDWAVKAYNNYINQSKAHPIMLMLPRGALQSGFSANSSANLTGIREREKERDWRQSDCFVGQVSLFKRTFLSVVSLSTVAGSCNISLLTRWSYSVRSLQSNKIIQSGASETIGYHYRQIPLHNYDRYSSSVLSPLFTWPLAVEIN